MSDDLVAWIREQLDDVERVAKGAYPGPWKVGYVDADRAWQIISRDRGVARIPDSGFNEPNVQHIAFHDPARVLRQVEAARRILDEYDAALANRKRHPDDLAGKGWLLATVRVVKLLALPLADRPGYRSEWAPADA